MDGDYVTSLLMGVSAPGLDFGALDGGILDSLCAGGGELFRPPRVAPAGGPDSREGSSVSDPSVGARRQCQEAEGPRGGRCRGGQRGGLLRQAPVRGSGLQVADAKVPPDSKKCKVSAGDSPVKPKVEEATASDDGSVGDKGTTKQGKGKSSKPAVEPPKDYVHVRARRGQATDSHSLAERVRREKISQRMKFLQDLVPGCNKVVGKALMLDEIINYVQSLQQQVEFLSMKLATVNPHLDFSNLPTLLHKDMYQACGPSQTPVFPLESAGAAFPFCDQPDLFQSFGAGAMEDQCSLSLLDAALPHTTNPQFAFQKQQRDFWEDGLQNALHIGSEQRQEGGVSAPNFDGMHV
ncbi:hypothetical protein PR202_gb22167 [Eleusine coracana subsp. coracana]|uniref:BHLH domain-containing protein n=1 Tax=Eleusine coracana subsp. coracana TaxID=191504 RepID=A0AAV5FCV8_ELECO|nr:hypothetical protein PR202_gb22167 [Eleusine coracana subsp. coracana]